MRDKDSKYGIRPEEEFGVVQETWKRKDILDFCIIMGWYDLAETIEAIEITPKEIFTDKIKHGDIQVTLYRKADVTTFDDDTCPFHFTIEECK